MKATGEHRHAAIETKLGKDKLVLRSMSGREELGRLFDYHLVLLDPDRDVDPDDVVGTNATVRLLLENDHTRYINGFISSLSFLGYEDGAGVYHAQFVPWLWLLSRTSDCRSFQEKTVREILETVFKDHGFEDFEFRLTRSYKPKVFCVQYNETALNFVSRLMEHEGMYYWWKHENGKHTMVIVDGMSGHEVHPDRKTIEWRPRTGILEDGYMYDLRVQKIVSSGAFALNDYNFKEPSNDLRQKTEKEKRHAGAAFEHFEYPGVYRERDEGGALSGIRLEESQVHHETIDALVMARAMVCGYKFELKRAERKDQERNYLIVSHTLTINVDAYTPGAATTGDKFECHVTAIPDDSVFRPARVTPKPLIRGPQPALVVGPAGEEIYTDEHGRVKVHFYWDRRSVADEKSSKWVRVSHPSAGGGYGFVSLPRIGQEVIVEFMHGDPDQPIITGRVYNGNNKPPYDLPGEKTKTIWKTNSSKGGGGYNEMRFEDSKGAEQIFMFGQKDMDVRIKERRKEWTGHDQHLIIEWNQFERVDKDLNQEVKGHHKEAISKNHHATVGGDDLLEVTGSLQAKAGQDVRIEAGMNTEITTGMATAIKSGSTIVLDAVSITMKSGSNFVKVDPTGVTIMGTMVLINSGGNADSPTSVAKKPIDPPVKAEEADDSKAGKVEQSQGMGHASNPQTWGKQTVQDMAAQTGAPFYE